MQIITWLQDCDTFLFLNETLAIPLTGFACFPAIPVPTHVIQHTLTRDDTVHVPGRIGQSCTQAIDRVGGGSNSRNTYRRIYKKKKDVQEFLSSLHCPLTFSRTDRDVRAKSEYIVIYKFTVSW